MPERRGEAEPADVLGALRDCVIGFEARTAREVGSRRRFLAELDRLVDPLDQHADPVHVTGSAIVLGVRGTVLHLHKRVGRWLQPGGHIEPGEEPAQAALREAIEETGLPVRHLPNGPLMIHLDVHEAGAHVHLDLRYLLVSDDVEPAPAAGESQQVAWFSLDEAIGLADEALVDGLRRASAYAPS